MGWVDWWKGEEDPLDKLDPKLRDFLNKQAPRRYEAAEDATSSTQTTYREQVGLKTHTDPDEQQREQQELMNATQTATNEAERPLPAQSLFQDGRYRHLWKNYRPQAEIEDAGKSDQERLMDIVGGFRDRQAEVGRAALENCADEQWAVTDCFRSGSWSARMSMCKAENRQLSRCIEMQSRFLRALGYVSLTQRSEQETESIQLHADRLYHQMIDHEKAVAEAKENGLPSPPLPPVIESLPKTKDQPHFSADPVTFDRLPKKVQDRLARGKLDGLEGYERELAMREIDQYIALNQDLVTRMSDRYKAEYYERQRRRADGTERFGDIVKRYFDFRKYDPEDEEPRKPEAPSSS